MGEFERIARLTRRFGAPPSPAVGIGDDCAVLPPSGASTVLTVDAAVENVHFARELLSLDEAAERAAEAAMSDAAAMGASVRFGARGGAGLLCAWTLPASLTEPEFDALLEGTARAVERAGAVVLGGNLASAPVITLTTTVVARLDGPAMMRSGARVGDVLYTTGPLGAAALGLATLRAGRREDEAFAPFVRAWRSPRARLMEGEALARIARAAIDISDGLAQDAGHLANASSVGVILDADALPMLPGQRDSAAALSCDAVALALSGGEDYELLVALPPGVGAPPGISLHRVGEIVTGAGVHVRRDGRIEPYRGSGWDHFGPHPPR